MLVTLTIFYGAALAALALLSSFIGVLGVFKKWRMAVIILPFKYLFYWKAIELGTKHLAPAWIPVGITLGLALSIGILMISRTNAGDS